MPKSKNTVRRDDNVEASECARIVTQSSSATVKTTVSSFALSFAMRLPLLLGTTILQAIVGSATFAQAPAPQPHNIVLFVADGLRFRMVDDQTAPTWPPSPARA
jgi:hypothetical protein